MNKRYPPPSHQPFCVGSIIRPCYNSTIPKFASISEYMWKIIKIYPKYVVCVPAYPDECQAPVLKLRCKSFIVLPIQL